MTEVTNTDTDGAKASEGTPVEAPQIDAEATDGVGVGEGADTVSRAEYDALMATFNTYRQTVLEVSGKYTDRHGWCREVKNALSEIDPVLKPVTHGATATVSLRVTVKLEEQQKPVSESQMWNMVGNAVYELANKNGNVARVSDSYGVMEILSPFVMEVSSTDGLAPYVSPEVWKAQQEERERAERKRLQDAEYWGACNSCGKGVNRRYDCTNAECDMYDADSETY